MNIPYESQTLDNPNPIARFAHRVRFQRSMRLVEPSLVGESTLLDYGCGQGRFLHELASTLPRSETKPRLLGYDPYMSAEYPGYRVVSDPSAIADQSVDIMTCLEVCEHLDEAETSSFLDFAGRSLKGGGAPLVTVPIMIGPAVLMKELSRCLLFRRFSDTSILDLLRAALFAVPPPRADDIKNSHRGYDWRVTRARVEKVFRLDHIEFSPLPIPGWYGQSQAIMLFRKA